MMIPYGRQDVSEADIAAVVEVLRSDWLTQGPAVERFEQAVSGYCGARHAVAVSSGTAALHLACLALGLGPGDRLWTSPNTFVASANCALYCGAEVDFVDIDPRTYNLCTESLAKKLEQAERDGTLPKVVVPVHFAGQPCDMAGIAALAQRYGFHVIEDASHAVGARYRDTVTGDCRYSDMTVFSFHPVKIITSGEGGMVTTNDSELQRRLASRRSHGISRDPAELTRQDQGGWYYEQQALGFNYRMTDMQAALGTSQLAKIDAFVARRAALAARYDQALDGLGLILPRQQPDCRSAHHLYPVCLPGGAGQRRRVYEHLHRADIRVQVHYIPVHTQPYYRELGFRDGQFPQAEAYYASTLSLPLFPALTEAEQDRVVAVLTEALD